MKRDDESQTAYAIRLTREEGAREALTALLSESLESAAFWDDAAEKNKRTAVIESVARCEGRAIEARAVVALIDAALSALAPAPVPPEHSCDNCMGIDPATCFFNPVRVPPVTGQEKGL